MDETLSLIEQRKAKLAALRAKGIDPFQNKFTPGETLRQARANYAEGREVAVAGRVTAHRDMGKSMFIDIRDRAGASRFMRRKMCWAMNNSTFSGTWTSGDFLGVRGHAVHHQDRRNFRQVTAFVILAKACARPGEMARPGRYGNSLPPALSRSDGQSER